MFSIDNIIFTIWGQGLSLLELVALLTGLCSVFLAVKGKVLNFWVGYFYLALLFMMFLQKHLYSSMMLQPISLALSVFGHYRWTHPRQGEEDKKEELKVTILSWRGRCIIVVIVLAFMVAWGFFLSKLNLLWPDYFYEARQPFLDAFVTVMMLIAQYLSAQKKIDCWAFWLMVNITNGILYIMVGLVFMPVVCAVYLVLAFMGFFMWRKQMLNQVQVK